MGTDGEASSYDDYDLADTILPAGHDPASQQTVHSMRLLDRLEGSKPPKLVVIDPRTTESARRATVLLAPRVGTNVAVMNGLLPLIIEAGQIDHQFIERHIVGFEGVATSSPRTPTSGSRRSQGSSPETLCRAADVLGRADGLISGVLQGFDQSNPAGAAAIPNGRPDRVTARGVARPAGGGDGRTSERTAVTAHRAGSCLARPPFTPTRPVRCAMAVRRNS